jgi:hypothetical protein
MIETWSYKFIDRVKQYLEYMLTMRHLVDAVVESREEGFETLSFSDLPQEARELILDKFTALTTNGASLESNINDDIRVYIEEKLIAKEANIC